MDQVESTLARVMTPEAYQAQRLHVFPSKTSIRWFIQSRRRQLVEARALLFLSGRNMVDPVAFDQVVIDQAHAKVLEAA